MKRIFILFWLSWFDFLMYIYFIVPYKLYFRPANQKYEAEGVKLIHFQETEIFTFVKCTCLLFVI